MVQMYQCGGFNHSGEIAEDSQAKGRYILHP
jgi:hypothetical protein